MPITDSTTNDGATVLRHQVPITSQAGPLTQHNPPVVTGPVIVGATSVSGTGPVTATAVFLYRNNSLYATVTLTAGAWSHSIPAAVGGDLFYAFSTGGITGYADSAVSNVVTVASIPDQPHPPRQAWAYGIKPLS